MDKFLIIAILGVLTFSLSLSFIFTIQSAWSQFQQLPTVSTRDHFDKSTGQVTTQNTVYDIFNNEEFEVMGCPPEIVLYVHGVWTGDSSLENSDEIFDRLRLSLENNNYPYPLIGYSWDSDTPITPQGWNLAKQIAIENGPILGGFIKDYKMQCLQTEIRVVAHSLGAKVVLESLDYLEKNQDWNNNSYRILSVNLLGAAVDDDEVSMESISDSNNNNNYNNNYNNNSEFDNINYSSSISNNYSINSHYGYVIENQAVTFYNYYNSEDDVLEPDKECWYFICQPIYYPFYEGSLALGQIGVQSGIMLPNNYVETNVTGEIPLEIDADADGECDLFIGVSMNCTIYREGDNHFGYIGIRSNENELLDDGIVDIMVKDWNY